MCIYIIFVLYVFMQTEYLKNEEDKIEKNVQSQY